LSVGRSEDLIHARRLIEAGAELGAARDVLADPAADLAAIGG
jgi:hypothetical protein